MTKSSSTPKIVTKKHIARLERERRQVAIIRTVAVIAIMLVVLLVGYGVLSTTYLKKIEPVAEVNGEKINLGYWQERVQMYRLNLMNTLQQYQFYQSNFGLDTSQQQQQIQAELTSPETLGQQTLDQLVDEVLIRQEAKKRGITVSAAEIDEKLQGGFSFYPNGTPTPTVTPTEVTYPTLTTQQLLLYPPTLTPTPVLTSTPAPTNTPDLSATATVTATSAPATPTALPQLPTGTATPYTLEGYKKQYSDLIKQYKGYGISEATFRSVYENQIYREKLTEAITKDVPTTEEQVLARHILVDDGGTAATIEALLAHGGDFAALARQYSKDTGSAEKGGELDWSTHSTFVKEFGDAAFTQPIGVIGQPVKTQYGFHIIQVIARENLPLNASAYQQAQQTAFTDWLTKTRDDAKTAKQITTYDVWKDNIPAAPQAVATP